MDTLTSAQLRMFEPETSPDTYWLPVLSVRAQRVQEITEADAAACGYARNPLVGGFELTAKGAYSYSANVRWDANPWQWAYEIGEPRTEGGAGVEMMRAHKFEPRVGEVLYKAGKKLHFTRIVRRVKVDEILYQDGFGQVCAATPSAFARWAKDAEVIRRGDDGDN